MIKKNNDVWYESMFSPAAQISIFAALAFLVLGSPAMYKLTSSLAFGAFTDDRGAPTFLGTFVHAGVAGLAMALYLTMFGFSV